VKKDHPPFVFQKITHYDRFTATALLLHCNLFTDTLCFTHVFVPLVV
jgi:hypothetical protein